MKSWLLFVACTIVCWGAYVPTIHHGAQAFGGGRGTLRAFLFVGLAYFLMAGAVLVYLYFSRAEPLQLSGKAMSLSTMAGLAGAVGALGVIFGTHPRYGGSPLVVAPLVFAGAPIVNTVVSMIWDKPSKSPSFMFYFGIVLACAGAAFVLRFKPT